MNIYKIKLEQFSKWSQEIIKTPLEGSWLNAYSFMERGNYFKAPASTKYHLSVEGGLLIHSVCVTELALRIHETLPIKCPRPFILTAGLLHDVGKCGFLTDDGAFQPRYTPNPRYKPGLVSKWNGAYEYNESKPQFTVRDLSALLVAKWGFPWEIVQAVLIHDGQYDPANTALDYKGGGFPLSGLLQMADCFHAQQLEKTQGIIPLGEEK